MLGYITNTLSPEIFSIGIISIKWYSLLFALTFVVGYAILQWFFKREGRNSADVDKLVVYIMIGTVIGARLGHCLFYAPDYYLAHPEEILMVWKGGLASHGGAIGILLAIWLFVHKNKDYTYLWIVDRVVIAVALGGLFIRTGNYFNSEIYGKVTDVPWAVVFAVRDNLPRHPSQIYEAIAYFAIFLILLSVYRKSGNAPKSGLLFGLFLVLIFSVRFVLEFTKEIQSSFEADLPIDMGQILSIPFILVGIFFIVRTLSAVKKIPT
ncbi:MAG: prolipoprotein diacylglyceryl transferase [Ignavibacteria bacterium]|jgi:prolipoprotein diacylglyceryl transferase|nr:prolipoprotein diacylglyceryl transferase [Ignavibacteria bacterium]